jgi:hypothetical protein
MSSAGEKTIDSRTYLPAVVQAVEDEIYDMHHEGAYMEIDDNAGGGRTPATINIYVSKTLSDGVGIAIYKDMPYGEVFRYFVVDGKVAVRLSGDPTSFRPTGGSMLTVYMTDKTVCKFIRNAYHTTFTVDPSASPKRIRKAEERQLRRTGYSFRLDKGTGRYD